MLFNFFFFNDPATTEIYTLSLHDALPISQDETPIQNGKISGDEISFTAERPFGSFTYKGKVSGAEIKFKVTFGDQRDRKSTRLNSSHSQISYAVFCLKNTDHV